MDTYLKAPFPTGSEQVTYEDDQAAPLTSAPYPDAAPVWDADPAEREPERYPPPDAACM